MLSLIVNQVCTLLFVYAHFINTSLRNICINETIHYTSPVDVAVLMVYNTVASAPVLVIIIVTEWFPRGLTSLFNTR